MHAAVIDKLTAFIPAESKIQSDTTLMDLGVDSLSIVELRNHIASATGITLSNELILSNPSIGAIESAIVEELEVPATTQSEAIPIAHAGGHTNTFVNRKEIAPPLRTFGL